jgi:uncharacterized protein YjbI with pentapeptide repeats
MPPEPKETGAADRAGRLCEAANNASGLTRNIYFTFLLLGTYIAVTIGSTTDEQLLEVAPVTLPILNVGIPIVAFYAVVPWLFLLFHFYLLLQLYLLARKLHLFDAAVLTIDDEVSRADQYAQLFPFPFNYMVVDHQQGRLNRVLFGLVVWVTVILLPLILLVGAQIRFLPYHDAAITWSSRAAILMDLVFLWTFWPKIVTPSADIRRDWWMRIITGPVERIKIVIGWIGSFKRRLPPKIRKSGRPARARGILPLALTSFVAIVLSMLVAVLPGGSMETWVAHTIPERWLSAGERYGGHPYFGLTYLLFDASKAPFHRSLDLAGKTLVAGEPSAEVLAELQSDESAARERVLKQIIGLNLANRDLRFADFRNARMPKVNLRGSNLHGADLRLANLSRADMRPFDITDGGSCVLQEQERRLEENEQKQADINPPREPDGLYCLTNLQSTRLSGVSLENGTLGFADLQGTDMRDAQLQGARLGHARLQETNMQSVNAQDAYARYAKLSGARLVLAKLQGADLRNAHLQGASLFKVNLQGARLYDAQLIGAELSESQLQGADFGGAELQGADLERAMLYGARLTRTDLRGATLVGAKVQGADMRAARLDGADLTDAGLQGAALDRARLNGVDLQRAAIGGTSLTGTQFELSNFNELKRKEFTEEEYKALEERMRDKRRLDYINDKELLDKILQRLRKAIGREARFRSADAPEKVYCDGDTPFKTCLYDKDSKDYNLMLVDRFLAPLACNDVDIARSMLRRLHISRGEAPGLMWRKLSLADSLMRPDCQAGSGFLDELKGKYGEMSIKAKMYGVTLER